jgi:hypothetical protein
MNLVIGECNRNDMDAVRRYTEKYSDWKVPNVVLSFLLNADFERQEHFIECDGMLADHFLYVIYGSLRLLQDSLLSIPDVFAAHIGTSNASVYHISKE